MRLAASITSVPAGTETFCSLIVKLICFGSAMCSQFELSKHQQIIRGPVGTFAFQVVFKLILPFFHDADRRHRSSIAKRAKSFAQHILSKLADQRDILTRATAIVKAIEHLAQPRGAFTA